MGLPYSNANRTVNSVDPVQTDNEETVEELRRVFDDNLRIIFVISP